MRMGRGNQGIIPIALVEVDTLGEGTLVDHMKVGQMVAMGRVMVGVLALVRISQRIL